MSGITSFTSFFPRTRSITSAVAILAAALVGACSGDSSSGPDPDPVDAATVTLGAQSFSPRVVVLFRDGTVTWNNTSGVTHNVTFAGVLPADIPDHSSGSNARLFAAAGTYNYSCSIHAGMNGRVTVVDP
jgi:plastocyanin